MEALELAEKGNLPYFHLVTRGLGLGFGQAHAANLRLAVGAGRDPVAAHRPCPLAGYLGRDHHARHGRHVGQLGQTGHYVADGEDARFPGLHPLIDADEAALHLNSWSPPGQDRRYAGARPTATSTFSASFTTCLPSAPVKVTFTPSWVFSTFSTLAPV